MKKYSLSLLSYAVVMAPIVTTPLFAAPPAVVKKSQQASLKNMIVQVTLPEEGKGGSYTNNGKKVMIAAGKTVVLPSSATEIRLPKGSFFIVLNMKDNESFVSANGALTGSRSSAIGRITFTATEPVVFPNITNLTMKSNKDGFGKGQIRLPSGKIVDPSDLPSVNPFAVLIKEGSASIPSGEGVTDGN